ncbi:pentapeptide repeat-containing protein [Tenacibaculum ovolyticum]|uniref:pentapeptide repeat-containing protein n=1 Tax=Tenacibaculum ovolyticum TaxID=104270 RepID=UPI001F241D3A|nr:pentapeptide repeat-containing protein [Tenacibaculum ovolyticum]
MLDEKRINYFLNTEYKNLEESEYNELIEGYFRKSKDTDEWYETAQEENDSITKNWKEEKIIEFWKLIRIHTMEHSKHSNKYDFSYFVFPKFENYLLFKMKINKKEANFWKKDEQVVFDKVVNFDYAHFLGKVNFTNYLFLEESYFNHSIFIDYTNFNRAVFKGKSSFTDCQFKNYSSFEKTVFEKESSFFYAKFNDAYFKETNFNGVTVFDHASFSGFAYFNWSQFNGDAIFEYTKFLDIVYFNGTKFKSRAKFLGVEFNKDKNVVFSDLNSFSPRLEFISINFTNNIIFRRVNLKRVSFLQSEITDLKFKNCDWGNENYRLVTEDEKKIPLKEGKYAECEEIYRQLKKNFENNKDWKLSGEAYASEMEMRKRQLKEDANFKSKKGWNSFLNYLFYLFYDIFSCYTQSFVRPLIILIVSWLIVFPLLYLIFGCYSLQENHSNIYFSDLIFKSLEKMYCGNIYQISTSNTFLILKSEYKSYWWLMAIQKILSSILTVFIVLALRKRFKQ